MKKTTLIAALVATCLGLTNCGPGSSNALGTILTGGNASQTSQTATNAAGSLLGGALSALLNGISTISEADLYGTWTYQASECRFESENFLAQAGGEAVASDIEKKLDTYLSQIGIQKGVTTYTFTKDKKYSIASGGRTISSGTYTFDAKNKKLVMTGALGLLKQNCTVGRSGANLCILYDADKLLTAANAIGTFLGQSNATIGSITNVIGSNYKGMKLGFSMKK